jgi:hypothetical protein
MRRALIRISEANAAGFPVELFNLSSGTEVSIAVGVIPPGTIDAPGASAALAGPIPPAGLSKAGRAIYDALGAISPGSSNQLRQDGRGCLPHFPSSESRGIGREPTNCEKTVWR